jgi:hypothetical protein
MTTSISTAIEAMVSEDLSRDMIIIKLATEHGCSVNKATKEYAAYAKANGLTASVSSHKEAATDWLAIEFADREWNAKAVSDAVKDIVNNWGVAESTARDYCKAYSESIGVAHPVADPRAAMFAFLIENRHLPVDVLKADFKAYAKDELGRSPSNINEYWKGYELHLALTAAIEEEA